MRRMQVDVLEDYQSTCVSYSFSWMGIGRTGSTVEGVFHILPRLDEEVEGGQGREARDAMEEYMLI